MPAARSERGMAGGVEPEREVGFAARLHANGETFDASDAALLRAVDTHESLNAAADALDRSYAHSHERLEELEGAFGSLVTRQRGGPGGGGSRITEVARTLLARFERLRVAIAGVARSEETVFSGRVVARDGELATVETAAGRVCALAPVDCDEVDLTVQADAVTIHASQDNVAAETTSARNHLPGTVTAVDNGESVARVAIDVGADAPVVALVTVDSTEQLDLRRGATVIASFKATATRATAGDGQASHPRSVAETTKRDGHP